ncbi:MAG: 16S rRNA (uracil(1498)-N(3))-methyltransferase [Rikenellaceae bacterium]|nr:16S rRNA (uracil(1498)-N(3))-methyltransferase [Rikenellaceae bacterium]
MYLFYTPEINGPKYTMTPEESRHCLKVLRLSIGDTIHLTDGKGRMFECRIISDDSCCEVEVVNVTENYDNRTYALTMAVAPTKINDRYEWFLEKSTEIGIDAIIPVLCSNSERRTIKRERYEKIITSAVKQSIKAVHPVVKELTLFKDLIGIPFEGDKFIAHCRESADKKLFKDVVNPRRNVLILVGPEGDFTEEEVALAAANGFKEISLGTTRLRVETAALVACHTVAYVNQ